MNLAFGVDIVLFIRIFVVVRLAVLVEADPGKSSLSSSTATRTWWILALYGLMSAHKLTYVTFLSYGTCGLDRNRIVFDSFFIRVPTPWVNIPKLLTNNRTHVNFLGYRSDVYIWVQSVCCHLPLSFVWDVVWAEYAMYPFSYSLVVGRIIMIWLYNIIVFAHHALFSKQWLIRIIWDDYR